MAVYGAGDNSIITLVVPPELTVSGSPLTGSGTLTVGKATQSPNTVWAGPSSGSSPSVPTMRQLVPADLPSVSGVAGSYTNMNATIDGYGRVISAANGTGGSGTTLTQVVFSIPNYTISSVISSGTQTSTATFLTQTANQVFAAPDGSNGTPGFRSLNTTDLPFRGALAIITAVGGSVSYPAKLTFQSTQYDTDSFFNVSYPTRLTVPSGVRTIELFAQCELSTTSGAGYFQFYKNGSAMTVRPNFRVYWDATSQLVPFLSTGPLQVSSGDYFECYLSASVTATFYTTLTYTFFGISVIN